MLRLIIEKSLEIDVEIKVGPVDYLPFGLPARAVLFFVPLCVAVCS